MATMIRVTCPACDATVDMGPDAVVIADDEHTYAFSCPSCGSSVEKAADRKIVTLLRTAGVQTAGRPVYPEELNLPDAPPFTWDDMIDWHNFLFGESEDADA